MSDEGFLRRWARRKNEFRTEVREGPLPVADPAPEPAPLQPAEAAAGTTAVAAHAAPHTVSQPVPPETVQERPLPTMDDVATLDASSDFSAFVARGVDQAVRRSALKKLFADPHFNTMDRLDVYIDDYTQPSPVSEEMLAALDHAKSTFLKMIENQEEQERQAQEPQTQQPPEQETQ